MLYKLMLFKVNIKNAYNLQNQLADCVFGSSGFAFLLPFVYNSHDTPVIAAKRIYKSDS
jgi:hypothetical protein